MDEIKPKDGTKKSEIITAVILVAICIIAAVYLAITFTWTEEPTTQQKPVGSQYTSVYSNITAEAAYDLINNTIDLTVIDCRGRDPEGCTSCKFGHGHLPGAVLNMNPQTIYNATNDLLVYSGNGTAGAEFCQELTGHVYGKIYNLDGGYDAWDRAKYPLVQGG